MEIEKLIAPKNFVTTGYSSNCKIKFAHRKCGESSALEIWVTSGDNQDLYNLTYIHGIDVDFVTKLQDQLEDVKQQIKCTRLDC